MGKPFNEKKGIFHLEDIKNKDALIKRLTAIVKKEGTHKSIKEITIGPDKKPYRISTKSLDKLFNNEADSIKIKPRGSNLNRSMVEIRPGSNPRPGSRTAKQTEELTQVFIDRVSGIAGSTPEKIQQYFAENNQQLRQLHIKVAQHNQKLKKSGVNPNQRISRGHYARVSKSVDSPRNLFIELLTENIAKGDKYSPNPGAMTVIGNPIKEGINPLENWARDYTTWLDKPENGGSGILPQRGDYSDLLEQKFNQITGEQWNTLNATEQRKALDTINDLTSETEKLNQWLPSEGAERRRWGLLSPDNAEQALAWANDPEFALERRSNRRVLDSLSPLIKTIRPIVDNPIVKKGAKYGLPIVGSALANLNRQARAAEYEEDPNLGNLVQKKIAQVQEGIEYVDTATGGATNVVTWIPNIAGDVIDAAIETTQDPNYEPMGSYLGVREAVEMSKKYKKPLIDVESLSEEEKLENQEHVDSIPNVPAFL